MTTIGTLDANTQSALAATTASSARNFGRDTWCTTSLRTGVFVSGVLLVAQAAFRRLTTPRGSLYGGEDEANYGLDLAALLGAADSPNQQASVPGQVEAELLKDQRINAVTVTLKASQVGPVVSYEVTIKAVTDAGPFTLVLGVADVTVQLLGVAA